VPSVTPRTIAILAVAAFVAAMVVGRLTSGAVSTPTSSGGAATSARPAGVEPSLAPPPAAVVVVDVVGAVRHPGVYSVPEGARVREAVAAAGGITGLADRSGVNLAARVVDGEQVVVPARGVPHAPGVTPPRPVSLNLADASTLESLPGIGPAMAARIVAWRLAHGPFRTIDALVDVPGIGPRLLARLRARLAP
jgi:competence protein ComEA